MDDSVYEKTEATQDDYEISIRAVGSTKNQSLQSI